MVDLPAGQVDAADALQSVTAFYSRIDVTALARTSGEEGDAEKDVGGIGVCEETPAGASLAPADEQAICEKILSVHGRANVTRAKLGFVPPWFIDNALEDELRGWDKHIAVENLTDSVKGLVIAMGHMFYFVLSLGRMELTT